MTLTVVSFLICSFIFLLLFLPEIDYKAKLKQWKNVTVIHSLALLMGPLIESIALVDKYMYLVESGLNLSIKHYNYIHFDNRLVHYTISR